MTQPSKRPTIRHRPPPGSGSTDTQPDRQTEYEVGYGRPPTGSRFKPGQSGNPRGRPKGARGVNAMIRATLEQKVELRVGSRVRKVSRIEALLVKQIELASKGEHRALVHLIQAYRQAVPDPVETVTTGAHEDETDADRAILEAFLETVLATRKKEEC